MVLQDHLPCGIVTRGDLLSADPGLERRFAKSRCQCCGLTRHLRTMADGATLCVYCSEPGTDAEINHISAE